ncbi:MAG: hypothetical protein AAB873_01155 [Patescibacteria group bacterium]
MKSKEFSHSISSLSKSKREEFINIPSSSVVMATVAVFSFALGLNISYALPFN